LIIYLPTSWHPELHALPTLSFISLPLALQVVPVYSLVIVAAILIFISEKANSFACVAAPSRYSHLNIVL
jgi:hypothetical protein